VARPPEIVSGTNDGGQGPDPGGITASTTGRTVKAVRDHLPAPRGCQACVRPRTGAHRGVRLDSRQLFSTEVLMRVIGLAVASRCQPHSWRRSPPRPGVGECIPDRLFSQLAVGPGRRVSFVLAFEPKRERGLRPRRLFGFNRTSGLHSWSAKVRCSVSRTAWTRAR